MREWRVHAVLTGRRANVSSAGDISVELVERVGPARYRAKPIAGAILREGDQLGFGDQSNRVCLIGTLSAWVAAVGADTVDLDFEFHGSALDEMIDALDA